MTTPERLKRRQVRNDWFIAAVAVALVVVFIYFRGQDNAQETCFNNYFAAQAETSKTRSELVARESDATRRIISQALTAQTREDLIKARERYFRALKAIDAARANNPIPPFPEGICR